uniref:Uncharacterized protein n=1 Tax=Cacopsylla melanoneura TaxID=428564 RepID=A0A8D8RHU0_9HEMI
MIARELPASTEPLVLTEWGVSTVSVRRGRQVCYVIWKMPVLRIRAMLMLSVIPTPSSTDLTLALVLLVTKASTAQRISMSANKVLRASTMVHASTLPVRSLATVRKVSPDHAAKQMSMSVSHIPVRMMAVVWMIRALSAAFVCQVSLALSVKQTLTSVPPILA